LIYHAKVAIGFVQIARCKQDDEVSRQTGELYIYNPVNAETMMLKKIS